MTFPNQEEQQRRIAVQLAALRGEPIQKMARNDRGAWWVWMDPEKNAEIEWNWAAFNYQIAVNDEIMQRALRERQWRVVAYGCDLNVRMAVSGDDPATVFVVRGSPP